VNDLYDQLFDRFQNKFFSKNIGEINNAVEGVKKVEDMYFMCFRSQIYRFYGVVIICIILGIVFDFYYQRVFRKQLIK